MADLLREAADTVGSEAMAHELRIRADDLDLASDLAVERGRQTLLRCVMPQGWNAVLDP
jgi:hypothetical protein